MTNIKQLRGHPRVDSVDGREAGFEDWFVYLVPGWRWRGFIGEHAHGFTTLREALAAVKLTEPCGCDECKSNLDECESYLEG